MRKTILIFLIISSISHFIAVAQNVSKPNILFILADDMGYGDVSCFNPNARIKTVNLDNLAKAGMRFTAAHATSSVCTPSRYGILTGRYNWRSRLKAGVLGAYALPLIDSSRLTIADILKSKGYRTAAIGKWHLGLEFSTSDGKSPYFDIRNGQTNIEFAKPLLQTPNDLGFDYFYGVAASADMPPYMFIQNRNFVSKYDTIKGNRKYMNVVFSKFFRPGPASYNFTPESILPDLTEKAKEYIDKQSKKTPFFLYFALTAPHTPVAPDSAFKGKSGVGIYLDFCLELDHVVGEIVKTLKEKELYDNTLIIFTSDNGYAPYVHVNYLENHGDYPSYIFRGYKSAMWEGGHRIPLIAEWPGKIEPRTITDQVVSLADWFRTAASIVNYHVPDNAGEDSYNLLPLLLGEKYNHPLRQATVYSSFRGDFAIQKGVWEFISCNEKEAKNVWVPDKRYDSAVSQADTPFQLFNIRVDPEQTNNLYNRYPKKVQELKAMLSEYIRKGRSTPGKNQMNAPVKKWHQISWMNNYKEYIKKNANGHIK